MATAGAGAHKTDYDFLVRIVIIGDAGVGKSSLLIRYAEDVFDPTYIATIGVDFRICTMEKAGKVIKVQVWDTAGQERFKTITQSYYRGADAVGVCFDLTDRESFQNIEKWINDAKLYSREDVSLILIGTKADLPSKRVVSAAEAQAFADGHGFPFIETSAKENSQVRDAFSTLVDDLLAKREKRVEASEKKDTVHLQGAEPVRTQKKCAC